jgi:predicted anti-sigma-YlaC factor YlaD
MTEAAVGSDEPLLARPRSGDEAAFVDLVDRHGLAGCAGCRAYLDQMQRTITLLRRVADGDPEAVTHRATLAEAFRAWRDSRDSRDTS